MRSWRSTRRHGDALATGDVVNTAARLQSAAPRGTPARRRRRIKPHATPSSTSRTTRSTRRARRGRRRLAGRRGPPRVRAGGPGVASGRRPQSSSSSGLSGTRQCTDRRPHVVTVLGSPGVGKSRLCREVAALVAATAVRSSAAAASRTRRRLGIPRRSRRSCGRCPASSDSTRRPRPRKARRSPSSRNCSPEARQDERFRDLALLLGLGAGRIRSSRPLLLFCGTKASRVSRSPRSGQASSGRRHPLGGRPVKSGCSSISVQHLRESPRDLYRGRTARAARCGAHLGRRQWRTGDESRSSPFPARSRVRVAMRGCVRTTADTGTIELARSVETEGQPALLRGARRRDRRGGRGERRAAGDGPRAAIAGRVDALPPDARQRLMSAAVDRARRSGRTCCGGWRVDDVDERSRCWRVATSIRREPSSQLGGRRASSRFRAHAHPRGSRTATLPRAIRRERHAATRDSSKSGRDGAETAALGPRASLARGRRAGRRRFPISSRPPTQSRQQSGRHGVRRRALFARPSSWRMTDGLRRDLIRLQREPQRSSCWTSTRAARRRCSRRVLPELEGQGLGSTPSLHSGTPSSGRARHRDARDRLRRGPARGGGRERDGARRGCRDGEPALAMRGGGATSTAAYELGEQALNLWVPGTRDLDLAPRPTCTSTQARPTGSVSTAVLRALSQAARPVGTTA